MKEFQEKAKIWGWPEWCGKIYDANQDLKKRGNEPDFSDPRLSGLAASSFWLLVNLSSDANKPQIQIRDTIGRLTNTDGEQFDLRKFTRELFQNAFDSFSGAPEEPLFFRIELSEDRLFVYHNGRPFAGPSKKCKLGEMGALSEIGVTSKDAEFDLEGQYGIGFKGWSLFYKKVMVACCDHNSENDSCMISWDVGHDSLSIELGPGTKNVWGHGELPNYFRNELKSKFETPQNKPITTMYRFDDYHVGNQNIPLPTIGDLENELKGLTRFRSRSIIVQISVDGRETTLTHIAKESPIPELSDSFRYLDVTNTIEETGQDPIETKFVAIRTPIQANTRLRLPVDRFIEERRRRFSELSDENNPWKDVSTDSWFEKKSIIVGVKLNQDREIATLAQRYNAGEEKISLHDSSDFARSGSGLIGGKQIVWSEKDDNILTIESLDESYDEGTEISQDEEFSNNHWMYRMAPIDEVTKAWIPGESKLRTGSSWIIDAPFWLEQNRLRLSTTTTPADHIEANAELLRQALQSALPMLAMRLLDGGFSEDTELIYHSTPFDGFLSEDYSPKIYGGHYNSSPFQNIFWKKNQSNDWNLKSYNEIFKDGIFTDLDRKIIEMDKAVRVPDSWVLGESGERLVSWLNQNIDFEEDWFDIVFTHSTGKPKLVTERTSSLAKTIPPISKDRIYQLLGDSGKLSQLQASYPGLRGQEWFFAPIPDNVSAYISSEDRRPSGSLPDYLWQRCDEEGVMMAPPEAEATMEASEEWNFVNGIYVVSIPKGSTDGEWVDRMIEILGLLEVLEEDDFRQISKRGVNTTECSWFYSKVSSFASDEVSDALVKRSISRGRGYSLCLRTSTGWFEKVGDAIAAKDGERERDEPARSNLALIDDRANILLPTDSSVNDDIERSDHPVTLVPGSGLIPSIVMFMIRELSQRFSVPEWTNGIFLLMIEAKGEDIEYETPFPEDLSEAWVKTPNLIFTTESEEIIPNGISHDGKIGTKPTWRTMHRNRNHHSGGVHMKDHLESQVGHSIGIHKDIQYRVDNKAQNYEGTSVLSQDLEIRRLINDLPLDQFPLLKMLLEPYFKDQRRIHTIMKINENAASKTSNRVVFYWGRKQNTQEAWDIRQYEIIPPNSPLSNIHKALYSGGDKVFERDSFPFPRYGFRSPEKIDTIPWISGIGPEPPVQPPEGIQHISKTNIHYLIRNGSKEIGAIESLLRGITEYLDCFVEQRDDLETEDLSWLCDFLGRASRLAGIEGGGIDQLFTRFSDKISLTADTREGLLDWISEQEEITEKVQDLRTGLENLEVLNFDKLDEVISNLDPEEGWKRFTEEKLIQERSSHRFLPEPNQFESTREKKYRSTGDGKMFLVSEDDARRVFNITLEGEKEDALGWTTDRHSRTVILNQRIEKILEAEGAKGLVSGKFDFEGLQKAIPVGLRDLDLTAGTQSPYKSLEDIERWDFFRLILSLWGFSKVPEEKRENTLEDRISLCRIVTGHKSEKCRIFLDGPVIRLGTNGWDLRPIAYPPFVELVTSDEGIPESMLENISSMCQSEADLSQLMRYDFNNIDDWISLASHVLEISEDSVWSFVRKTQFRVLVNPYGGDGRQQWKQEHATPPKWREDSQGAIGVKSARKLLKSYKRALKELLRRGSSGAKSDDEIQKNLLRLVMTETGRDGGRDVFEDTLYEGVHSMLADEPRVSVTSDDRIRRMFIARRYPRKGTPENDLIAKANLSSFPGNVLLLSSFSQNLAQNYGQQWGLKENEDKPLRGMIEKLLEKETDWGPDEYIFLRGCMKAEGKALDLKVHKYHAVMIAALDFALEEAQ